MYEEGTYWYGLPQGQSLLSNFSSAWVFFLVPVFVFVVFAMMDVRVVCSCVDVYCFVRTVQYVS